MTQIGGFTAVYDMLNLRQGMPASCFVRLVRLGVASLGLRDTIFKAGVSYFSFFKLQMEKKRCLKTLYLLCTVGSNNEAPVSYLKL